MKEFWFRIDKIDKRKVEAIILVKKRSSLVQCGTFFGTKSEASSVIVRLAANVFTSIEDRKGILEVLNLTFSGFPISVMDGSGEDSKPLKITQLNEGKEI